MVASTRLLRNKAAVPGLSYRLDRPYVSLNYLLRRSTPPAIDPVNANTTLPYPVVFTPGMGLMAKGKQFITLYKRGIVNVWRNYGNSKSLLKSLAQKSSDSKQLAKISNANTVTQSILDRASSDRIHSNHKTETLTSSDEAKAIIYTNISTSLTRSEYQLLLRTPKDIMKLPWFTLIFCIFFEMTPIVVWIFPKLVPNTCALPSQVAKDQKKTDNLILASKEHYLQTTEKSNEGHLLEHSPTASGKSMQSVPASTISDGTSAYRLPLESLRRIATALSLFPVYLPISWVPQSSLAKAVEKHVNEIRADSYMLSWMESRPFIDHGLSKDIDPEVSADSGSNVGAESKEVEDFSKKMGQEAAIAEKSEWKEEFVGSGVWGINSQELVKACQDRLIPTSFRTRQEGQDKEIQKTELQLRIDLFYWIVNFIEGNNDAGYLITAPVSFVKDEKDIEQFYEIQKDLSEKFL